MAQTGSTRTSRGVAPVVSNGRARPYVAVAGNIGAGKTAVASALASRLDLRLSPENVEDNPFLARFYAEMTTWAFRLNMFFLGARGRQILDAARGDRTAILDRSLHEDRLFVDLAHADGITTSDDHSLFLQLYDVLIAALPAPAVLVYLHAPVDVLLMRIESRGRSYEREIEAGYLHRLQERYDTWIAGYDSSPVLHVDASSDLIAHDAALASVATRIKAHVDVGRSVAG